MQFVIRQRSEVLLEFSLESGAPLPYLLAAHRREPNVDDAPIVARSGPLDEPVVFKCVQVSSHGGGRDVETPREFPRRHAPFTGEESLEDPHLRGSREGNPDLLNHSNAHQPGRAFEPVPSSKDEFAP